MTLGPEHSIMINRCCILHCFKLRKNAALGDLFIFFIFLAVPTSKTLIHIAAECTIKQPCFQTMDWQLPYIGQTITNNILPSSLSQYVSGGTVTLSIGGSRLFPCIFVSCRVIPMDTHWFVYRQKN